jgi:hypothetical protein
VARLDPCASLRHPPTIRLPARLYVLLDRHVPHGRNQIWLFTFNRWCWWYRKYAPRNTELARLKQNARETKQGFLWEGQTHIPPWQWRKRTR